MTLIAACFEATLMNEGASILPISPHPCFIAVTCAIAVALVHLVAHANRDVREEETLDEDSNVLNDVGHN